MWDLPGPGLEPVSLALAGRCLTTALPGKPQPFVLKYNFGLQSSGDLDSPDYLALVTQSRIQKALKFGI